MTFSLIVAADRANGIGLAGALPWPKLAADLAHFRALTMGHAVIMGRRTWDSLPASVRPLPGRVNIVLSRTERNLGERQVTNATTWRAESLDAALDWCTHSAFGAAGGKTFVIGGGSIYALALAHPDLATVYLTRIDAAYECDTWLPPLDGWARAEVISEHAEPVPYRIERWERT